MGTENQIVVEMKIWIIKGQSKEIGVFYVSGKECLLDPSRWCQVYIYV